MIVIPQSNNLAVAKGVLGVSSYAPSISSSTEAPICNKGLTFTRNESVSVLDTRSPSPSASSSSCSYGGQHAGNNGVPGAGAEKIDGRKEELVTELQPFSFGLEPEKFNLGFGDLDNLLPELAGSDQTIFRWISGDMEDPLVSLKQLLQGGNANADLGGGVSVAGSFACTDNISFSSSDISLDANIEKIGSAVIDSNNRPNNNFENLNANLLAKSLPPALSFQEQQSEEKPQISCPQIVANQTQFQNSAYVNLFGSSSYNMNQEQPPPKRHNSGILGSSLGFLLPKVPFFSPSGDLLLRKQPLGQMQQQVNLLPPHQFQPTPLFVPKLEAAGGGGNGNGNLVVPRHQQQEQQFIYDQIFQASELLLAGHFSNAQMILARLNQQLSPIGKPFKRAAFYFKEALQLPFLLPCTSTSFPPRIPTPFDCVLKMDAYKAFSEVSPLIQFMNFTSNQAILEALGDAKQIHIIDFDIGCGAQWSSFMQELPSSNRKATSLKITAFVSPSTHHSVEIGIMHESLTLFANDVGIRFELEVINLDSFDPKTYPLSSLRSSECEPIAINFPIWSISSCLFAFPSLLHCMKQLSPKVVVSLERGCERTELPLKHHLLHALQYYEILLASVDAANLTPDVGKKIERSLFQSSIENMVLGRLRSPDRIPPWRNLFASAGFSPVAFSNLTEIQAECLVKRTQVGGFHVEKRQSSLVLCWKQRELLSALSWRC